MPAPARRKPKAKGPQPITYSVHPGVAMVMKWVAELKVKTGRTLDEVREYAEAHPQLQDPLYKVPHTKGVIGTAATFVKHVDGLMRAFWAARPDGDVTVLTVRPSTRLSAAERADVEAEGGRLLAFLAPGRGHSVRFLTR